MADALSTSKYYKLLGVNQKMSTYEFPATEFLDLRNVDFDVQGALQKRPGSTFVIANGNQTSGPINSLYEYVRLEGQSYAIAASDTALFLMQAQAYTLLSPGWNNGQPPDMLTFLDKVWMANGQSFASWDGNTFLGAGLPAAKSLLSQSFFYTGSGVSTWTVAGLPVGVGQVGVSYTAVNFMVAYSYIRYDGYEGPMQVGALATDMLANGIKPLTNGQELLLAGSSGGPGGLLVTGFTVPPGLGITAMAFYIQLYQYTGTPVQIGSGVVGNGFVGGFGGGLQGASNGYQLSGMLMPNVQTNFLFFTLLPMGMTALTLTTAQLPSWSGFISTNPHGPSGMIVNWFATNTPKYLEVTQGGVMFAAGFSNTPSTLWVSDIGTPEFYEVQNSFEIRTNDGDKILGIKYFSDQMIVTKKNSFHKITNPDADPSDFNIVEVSLDYGCLSKKTIIAVKQKLYWLDKKGIIYYDGATFDIISNPVEQIFRRMNITAAIENAVGVHHKYRNQMWFSFPVDGSTTNNITVVYDYLVNAWTFFDGFTPSSFGFIKQGLNKETVWRGDYSGLVHYFGESFYSDSSKGITCLALTRFENVGGENQTTLWRRLFLDVAPTSGITGTINGQVFTNYNVSSVQATFQFYQSQFQTRAEMGVQGKAIAAEISFFSASLPLLVNGYSWANRGLRNV